MKLVKQIQVTKKHPFFEELDNLTFLSKNLYNATLYEVRQQFFKEKTFLNYKTINKKFTIENQQDYRALPAKVSKHTQMLVDRNFKSFFALLKKKNEGKYSKPINIPKYLDKVKGKQVIHYEKGALQFSEKGFIKLSKTNIKIKSNFEKENVQFVRIVPKNNIFVIEIGYNVIEKPKMNLIGNFASIDLGQNNLITMIDTITKKPIIVNGKPVKSINQYYNKIRAKYQGKLEKKYWSNRLGNITLKRNNKIKDYMHKATTFIVNHLVSNSIDTLVVGYNKEWKQDIKMGSINNQNFVSIPFYILIQQLEYKCKLNGISFITNEEAYTSKCSFLDNEEIKKHKKYLGKRIKRGMFKTSKGILINADVNGALNILKKYLIKAAKNFNEILNDLVDVTVQPIRKIRTFL